jgi:anti-sigma B factor antagonist
MASTGLTFEVTHTADEITVRLAGEFDLASVAVFQQDILPLLSGGRPKAVIDLSGLTFLDSTGLFSLVKAWQELQDRGIAVRLVRGSEVVNKMLRLSGLDTEFD